MSRQANGAILPDNCHTAVASLRDNPTAYRIRRLAHTGVRRRHTLHLCNGGPGVRVRANRGRGPLLPLGPVHLELQNVRAGFSAPRCHSPRCVPQSRRDSHLQAAGGARGLLAATQSQMKNPLKNTKPIFK